MAAAGLAGSTVGVIGCCSVGTCQGIGALARSGRDSGVSTAGAELGAASSGLSQLGPLAVVALPAAGGLGGSTAGVGVGVDVSIGVGGRGATGGSGAGAGVGVVGSGIAAGVGSGIAGGVSGALGTGAVGTTGFGSSAGGGVGSVLAQAGFSTEGVVTLVSTGAETTGSDAVGVSVTGAETAGSGVTVAGFIDELLIWLSEAALLIGTGAVIGVVSVGEPIGGAGETGVVGLGAEPTGEVGLAGVVGLFSSGM